MSNNLQSFGAGGLYSPSSPAVGGGGSLNGDPVSVKDALDWARLGSPGRIPEATYPDGYLGTRATRRYEDRLLKGIGSLNRRSYIRGVHKGERIDPGDYYWPDDWQPDRGLQAQARGVKTPLAAVAPMAQSVRSGTNTMAPTTAPAVEVSSPNRRAQLGWLAPSWGL